MNKDERERIKKVYEGKSRLDLMNIINSELGVSESWSRLNRADLLKLVWALGQRNRFVDTKHPVFVNKTAVRN